jgi:hypothetical protein
MLVFSLSFLHHESTASAGGGQRTGSLRLWHLRKADCSATSGWPMAARALGRPARRELGRPAVMWAWCPATAWARGTTSTWARGPAAAWAPAVTRAWWPATVRSRGPVAARARGQAAARARDWRWRERGWGRRWRERVRPEGWPAVARARDAGGTARVVARRRTRRRPYRTWLLFVFLLRCSLQICIINHKFLFRRGRLIRFFFVMRWCTGGVHVYMPRPRGLLVGYKKSVRHS